MVSKACVFRERKDCVLRVRVSKRVKEQLQKLAEANGMPVSEFLRFAINEMLRESIDFKELIEAVPVKEEPDRAYVKWPKRKGKKSILKKRPIHPGTKKAREILRMHGRSLERCDLCGRYGVMHVHHKDGNPYNNNIENLAVLCPSCHRKVHNLMETEEDGIQLDYDALYDFEEESGW